MNKTAFWIPVLVGLAAGRVFAEGERPFKVSNTVRVNYSDNYHHTVRRNRTDKLFTTDALDLSFRAALSERTDVRLKSRLDLLGDGGTIGVYPNLYATLGHEGSPRLLLGLSEYFRSSRKTAGDYHAATGKIEDKRYSDWENKVGASADYVLTEKDRLQASLKHEMLRNDRPFDRFDNTTVESGLSWKRELVPQRTTAALDLRERRVTYDHLAGDEAFLDQTELTVGLNQTFNPEWAGNGYAGGSHTRNHFDWNDQAYLDPNLGAGLSYAPSPATKLSADLSLSRKKVDDRSYTSQEAVRLSWAAEHEITAKLTAKAKVSLSEAKYDAKDGTQNNAKNEKQEGLDIDLRLTYKVHRMHFLETGITRREVDYDVGSDWKENRVDIGWRMDLN